jgi:hypothetical protein
MEQLGNNSLLQNNNLLRRKLMQHQLALLIQHKGLRHQLQMPVNNKRQSRLWIWLISN